jgi:hypothetical protein
MMARSLEKKGLRIDGTIPRASSIFATGDSSLVDQLKRVEGVEAVRPQEGFKLPPMDDDTPQ